MSKQALADKIKELILLRESGADVQDKIDSLFAEYENISVISCDNNLHTEAYQNLIARLG